MQRSYDVPFKFFKTEIPDIILIEAEKFPDERGFFEELFKQSEFEKAGINFKFVQLNHSFSRKGVIRGLHYQEKPKAQGKLVTVLEGKIFDVAVDIRSGLNTFGKWVAREITPGRLFWIPPEFAHGFQALEDSHVIYLVTEEYSPQHDRGIAWNDPDLSIPWPLKDPIVSKKDKGHPRLRDIKI